MASLIGLTLLSLFSAGQRITNEEPKIITRSEWNAKPPKFVEKFTPPAIYVIIHHSATPPVCNTTEECKKSMRGIQNFHQTDRGWSDIGYNYVIGGDGFVYTGRGFNVIGAHAISYNNNSVGICLMGNWQIEKPPERMLQATKDLINFGLMKGYIHPKYKLLGHREVSNTICPGDSLFNTISKWEHFIPLSPRKKPSSNQNEIS